MDTTAKKFFKTSMVGGFNRDDVFSYIESLTNQHCAEIQELKNELKAAASQNITLSEKNAEISQHKIELEAQCATLTKECDKNTELSEKVSVLSTENTELWSRIREREAEISVAQKELDGLRFKLQRYQNMEQELNKSKERIADLELSALQRADELEQEARARMEEEDEKHREEMQIREQAFVDYRKSAYEEVESLISEISSAYINVKGAVSGFKTGFKAVVTELAQEIDRVSEACDCVENSFGDLCNKCSIMRETCGVGYEEESDELEEVPEVV